MLKTSFALVSAACALLGQAEADEVSGNVAHTSDYVFRGVSLSDGSPAIQGGFDWTGDQLYAGVWGSSLAEGAELDLYVGWLEQWGPVNIDLAVMGYFYPGAADDDAEFDYVEVKFDAAFALSPGVEVGAGFYWAPDNYGDTGEAFYAEANISFAMSDAINLSAAFGEQRIEDPDGPFGAAAEDAYRTWNVGAELSAGEFTLDLRYHDTDINLGDDIEAYTYGPASYDAAWVATLSRAL